MEVKSAYTTKELQKLLGLQEHSSILRRARRESWQSQPRAGRGGGHEWFLSSMPADTRAFIATAIANAIAHESTTPNPRTTAEVFTVDTRTWSFSTTECVLYMLGVLALCLSCFFIGVLYGS